MTGACTEYELLTDTNLAALRANGTSPTPETISGRRRALPQHAHLTVAEGEVFVFVNGGGGGLGDPLLRDPELVAVDVASGYVSERAGGELHGVVLDAGGQVDRVATDRRRLQSRTARLGTLPSREASEEIEVGIGIRAGDSDWRCGYCDEPLGALTGNYRDACATRSRPVVEALDAAGMGVRPRRDGPPLLLLEHFCPACAYAVRTDVVLEGAPAAPAPALARVAQGQMSPRVIAS
jgi:N-methylhydantoinase B